MSVRQVCLLAGPLEGLSEPGVHCTALRFQLTSSSDVVVKKPGNPIYLRDKNEDTKKHLRALAAELGRDPGAMDRRYMFINSPEVLRRLELLCPSHSAVAANDLLRKAKCTHICEALWVLELESQAPLAHASELRELLNRMGATPSLYTILKRASVHFSLPVIPSPSGSTDTVGQLCPLLQDWRLHVRLRSNTCRHTALLRCAASRLVTGIAAQLEQRKETLKLPAPQLALARECVVHLQQLLIGLVVFEQDTLRCTRLLELVADDVFILSSLVRPCETADRMQKLLINSLNIRYGQLLCRSDVRVQAFTCSSGMDALTSALAASRSLYCGMSSTLKPIERIAPEHDYLEIAYVVQDSTPSESASSSSPAPILIANLNASAPRGRLDPSTLYHRVKQRLAQVPSVVVVLDITIETPDQLLAEVLRPLLSFVAAGQLMVILSKSFQKYATLGLAKVTAGANWLISSSSVCSEGTNSIALHLRKMSDTLQWCQTDDVQLLALILHYLPTMELQFIRRANDNAAFVAHLWPAKSDGDSFVLGLPFVLKHKPVSRWAFQCDTVTGGQKLLALGQVAKLWPLEDRDSFSSLMSSFLALDHVVRFNIGQEATEELVVRFYAAGHLLSIVAANPNAITPSVTLDHVVSVLQSPELLDATSFDALLDKLHTPATSTTGCTLRIISLLDFAYRSFVLRGTNAARLAALTGAFLSGSLLTSASIRNVHRSVSDIACFWLESFLSGVPLDGRLDSKYLLRTVETLVPAYRIAKAYLRAENVSREAASFTAQLFVPRLESASLKHVLNGLIRRGSFLLTRVCLEIAQPTGTTLEVRKALEYAEREAAAAVLAKQSQAAAIYQRFAQFAKTYDDLGVSYFVSACISRDAFASAVAAAISSLTSSFDQRVNPADILTAWRELRQTAPPEADARTLFLQTLVQNAPAMIWGPNRPQNMIKEHVLKLLKQT